MLKSLRAAAVALLACGGTANADIALEFTAAPELIRGTSLDVGAVYRFDQASSAQYATVEVISLNNVTLLDIDQAANTDAAFSPKLLSQSAQGSAQFAISLFSKSDHTPQAIHTPLTVSALTPQVSTVRLHPVSDVTYDMYSVVALSTEDHNTLIVRYPQMPGLSSGVDDANNAVTASIVNRQQVKVDVQAGYAGELSLSLLFEAISHINPVFNNLNDDPIAIDDSNSYEVNQPLTVGAGNGLLANDDDIDLGIDDDLLTLSSFLVNSIEYRINSTASIEEGAVTIDSDGAYQFIPAVNYAGSVAPIRYTVVDGNGGSDTAALSISLSSRTSPQRLTANAQTIEIVFDEDANNDGYINREELAGSLDVSVLLSEEIVTGDQITASSGDDTTVITVNENHLVEQRVVFEFSAPIDGQAVEVQASAENMQGQLLSEARAEIRADLTPTDRPTISIVADQDDSGFLSATEYHNDIVVNVLLPNGAAVGDVIQLDYGSGNESRELTPVDLAEGLISFTIPVATEGETLSVVAVIIDEAGNRSESGSDSALVDTTVPPVPSINPLLSASATPLITGEFPVNGDYGYAVTVNGVTYVSADAELSVTAEGIWRLELPAASALTSGIYDILAVVTDIAGNTSTDATADELEIDLDAPVITVANIAPSSDAAPTISGTTDNTDIGVVSIRSTDGVVFCAATTDQGSWSCSVRRPLMTGANNLLAFASDAAGNTTGQPFTVQVVFTSDSDGDGIADDIEGTADTDGDGIADYLDLDSDNDGITDLVEGMVDTDADGVRDYLDGDADGDGISDQSEAGISLLLSTASVGSNGIADVLESSPDSGEVLPPTDTDGDLRSNFRDLDSDNDGISDEVESNASASGNAPVAMDTDGDGVPDYIDLDSDNDGIPDLLEQLYDDVNADAKIDNFTDINLDGWDDAVQENTILQDHDNDGLANFIDLDSDGDGRFDITESGGNDVDKDGRHDGALDVNANGVVDVVDVDLTGGVDIDEDGIDDRYDADFSDDADTDADGIINTFDTDVDGNGLLDDVMLQSQSGEISQVYEFQPIPGAVISTGTGTLGGGCSLIITNRHSTQVIDPLLLLLLVLAQCGLWRRRKSVLLN